MKNINKSIIISYILLVFLFIQCDSFSFFSEADNSITPNSPILPEISPEAIVLQPNSTCIFNASNGTPPYYYEIVTGYGSINSETGEYTAPAIETNDIIRVSDSKGNTDIGTAIIYKALTISPANKTIIVNSSLTFKGHGGKSSYSFYLISGAGIINRETGKFDAPATETYSKIRIIDSLGNIADTFITVVEANTLIIEPRTATLITGNNIIFTASGGTSSGYVYTLKSGPGNLAGSTYTSNTVGTAIVKVTDSGLNTCEATITINSSDPLSISPTVIILLKNSSYTFIASGGEPPYEFSIQSGKGIIDPLSGVYTAPKKDGNTIIIVTDSLNSTVAASITIIKKL